MQTDKKGTQKVVNPCMEQFDLLQAEYEICRMNLLIFGHNIKCLSQMQLLNVQLSLPKCNCRDLAEMGHLDLIAKKT